VTGATAPLIAVLDANVLYPQWLRDVLLTLGLAWLELIVLVPWSLQQTLVYTSVASGILAVTVAGFARFVRLPWPWTLSWGGLAVFAAMLVGLGSFAADGTPRIDGPATAAGAAMLAIAFALAARPVHPSLHYLAVPTAGWAWIALALGMGWTVEATAAATALVFGVVAVLSVEIARSGGRAWRDTSSRSAGLLLARAWAGAGVAGVSAAALVALLAADRRPAWPAVSAGLGLLALASVRGATALVAPWLRETSGLLALAAVTVLGYGVGIPSAGLAAAAIAVGFLATLVSLLAWRSRSASPWLRPLAVMGVAASLEALVIGIGRWPRPEILVVALLAFGIQAAAFGLTLRRPAVLSCAPVFVLAAWFGIAAESLGGSAQWYTVPLALALLAEVEVVRWSQRLSDRPRVSPELLILEWAGVAILSILPLTQMFTRGAGFGLLAVTFGALVMLWGVVTRVRRRTIGGAVLATTAAMLMIAAAVAGQAPDSAFFWIIVAGVGFAVMSVVAVLEAYRSKSGRVMGRLHELMEGWEG
jgi:hypothetical protein